MEIKFTCSLPISPVAKFYNDQINKCRAIYIKVCVHELMITRNEHKPSWWHNRFLSPASAMANNFYQTTFTNRLHGTEMKLIGNTKSLSFMKGAVLLR